MELAQKSFYSIDSNIKINKKKVEFDGEFGKLDLPLEIASKKVDRLSVKGSLIDELITLESKDKKIKVKIIDDNLDIKLSGIDLLYNSDEKSSSHYNSLKLQAKKSNIIMNNKYKILADTYKIETKKDKTDFELKHKDANIKYTKTEDKEITLDVTDMNDTFVNSFFAKQMVKGGTFSLSASGKDDVISGKMLFNKNRIMNLAILNNLITIVNTTPALINPLLAVPAIFGMVTSDGFNLNGYSVNEGYVDFTYNFETSFLNLMKIHTVGNSVDFDGYASIDLKKLS